MNIFTAHCVTHNIYHYWSLHVRLIFRFASLMQPSSFNELILHSIIKCKCMCISKIPQTNRNTVTVCVPYFGVIETVAFGRLLRTKWNIICYIINLTMGDGKGGVCTVRYSVRSKHPAAIWTINHYTVLQ